MKSICLNMILKNEADVIQRCLSSVIEFIDYWVIVDTGSSDGTQKLVQEFLRQVPGELHERPWIDFAQNRNEALGLAQGKGDYLLFIDADERWEVAPSFKMPELDKDRYLVTIKLPEGISYYRQALINTSLGDWKWKGVVHEELESSLMASTALLEGVENISIPYEGSRGKDPETYWKDAQLLELALQNEPDHTRYAFFLAQTYQILHQYEWAIESWQRRAEMGGSEEEVFYALYAIGRLEHVLKRPPEQFMQSFLKAYQFRPTRVEPLFWMGFHEYGQKNYEEALRWAEKGISHPLPPDGFYVEQGLYDYGMLLLYIENAFELKKSQKTFDAAQKLFSKPRVPDAVIARVQNRLADFEYLKTNQKSHSCMK